MYSSHFPYRIKMIFPRFFIELTISLVLISIRRISSQDVFDYAIESLLNDGPKDQCTIMISDESILTIKEFSTPVIHMNLNDLPNEFNQTMDIGGQYGNRLKKASKYMVCLLLFSLSSEKYQF